MDELKNSLLVIDYTGIERSAAQYAAFSSDVMQLIRSKRDADKLLVIDYGEGVPEPICVVQDHINLSGSNPLVGPNNPCGDRFPKVTDIYTSESVSKLPKVITVGLKENVNPKTEEISTIKKIGADCWSYNLVPTMIVAAHAGLKVIGILISKKENARERLHTVLEPILQSAVQE